MLHGLRRQVHPFLNLISYRHPQANFKLHNSLNLKFSTIQPPKKPRRWFRRLVILTLFSTVSAGGALYMSKYFRDLLTGYCPKSKAVLDQVGTLIGGWYDELEIKGEPLNFPDFPIHRFKEKQPPEEPSIVEPVIETIPHEESKLSSLPSVEEVKQMIKERPRTAITDVAVSVHESLSEAQRAVKSATLSLRDLETATRNHIEGLREAVKSGATSKKMNQVSKLASMKEKAETKANAAVDTAKESLLRLQDAITQCGQNVDSPEYGSLPDGISTFGKLQYNLAGSLYEVQKLQHELNVLTRFRDLAPKNHEALQENLSAVYKDMEKASKDGSRFSAEELHALVVSAHDRISKLQALLTESEEQRKLNFDATLDAQRRADEELISEYVKRELDFERNQFELERYRWVQKAREATERELRQALARHSEHLAHMLRLKEEEKEHQFQYRVRELITQEKQAFEAALSGWIKRMRAIEDFIDGRTELDRVAKETQALWIACEALASSLSSAFPKAVGQTANATTGPLTDFIEEIRGVASTGRHPFVLSILETIPPETVERGVWFERSLKERFEKVYKVCRRVALVDETSASLYTYALSWLQSMLIFDYVPPKYLRNMPGLNVDQFVHVLTPNSELDSNETDTFLLLRSARVAMLNARKDGETDEHEDHDDGIELAVKLLGQLRGQSRLVVADWLEDARRYLEAKQAAKSLLAYSTARGLSTFQKRM